MIYFFRNFWCSYGRGTHQVLQNVYARVCYCKMLRAWQKSSRNQDITHRLRALWAEGTLSMVSWNFSETWPLDKKGTNLVKHVKPAGTLASACAMSRQNWSERGNHKSMWASMAGKRRLQCSLYDPRHPNINHYKMPFRFFELRQTSEKPLQKAAHVRCLRNPKHDFILKMGWYPARAHPVSGGSSKENVIDYYKHANHQGWTCFEGRSTGRDASKNPHKECAKLTQIGATKKCEQTHIQRRYV